MINYDHINTYLCANGKTKDKKHDVDQIQIHFHSFLTLLLSKSGKLVPRLL